MPQVDQATVRNRLLAALPPADFAGPAPALEPVELALKQVLQAPTSRSGTSSSPRTAAKA